MRAAAVVPILILLAGGVAMLGVQMPDPPRGPAWTWEAPAGIEWAALVGRGAAESILVATRDAHLQLLDPVTGKPRLTEPLAVRRGIRLAPSSAAADSCADEPGAGPADVAYCYDRHAACAIRLSDPPGLKWQYGRWPAAGEEFPGDPDTLTGWTLAQVADAGLILVNSDGRVVLLSHTDGSVRWQIELDRLRVARLHVRGNMAAVLWRAKAGVRAAFLRLGDERPNPLQRELGELWPVWSKLLSGGLLTVSSTEAVLYPKTGALHKVNIPGLGANTVAVDVFEPGRPDATDEHAPFGRGTLLLVAEARGAAAYDLSTGTRLWPSRKDAESSPDVCVLRVCGDFVVYAGQWGPSVREVTTGAAMTGFWTPHFLDCHLVDESLYSLSRYPCNPQLGLILVREQLATPAERESDQWGASSTVVVMQPVNEIRQVVWAKRVAVVVRPKELQACTLP